jgi:hypothetical protein
MADTYGNTIVAKGSFLSPNTYTYYNADHTFSMKAAWYTFKGTWATKDGKLCRFFLTPPDSPSPGFDKPLDSMPNPACTDLVPHHLGDTWTSEGRETTLVRGIQN